MISWIQKYFQKHFKLVFALILAAMAVPLIVIFTPSSGIGQGGQRSATRDFFGYNLGSSEDESRLMGDANLSATLQIGYAGLGGDQLQQYAFQRAAGLHLADQLHVPPATTAEIADFIKGLRAFAGPDGEFDAQRYASFRDSLKAGARLTEADVSRIIGDDVRFGKVRQLLAGPGYVLAADIREQLARAKTTWTLGVATADYATFHPEITPTQEQLTKFFSENTFRYEIGPRVDAAAVKFAAGDYLADVRLTDDETKAFFNSAPGRFQKPAGDPKNPAATKPADASDYLLVRPQVEAVLRYAKARQLATKAASDLTLALYESHLTNEPSVLDSFLGARHLKAQMLQPFTQADGPAEFDHSREVATAAFALDADRFYSDGLPVKDGAVVLLWKDTQPKRMPLLSEVLGKVTTDYLDNEKRKRFAELGQSLKQGIASRLKTGDDFARAVAGATAGTPAKFETRMLPPFTLAQPPKEADNALFGPLEHLQQGQVSDMVITTDKGLFVYAAAKQLPDLTEANPDYDRARRQIAAVTSRVGASEYLDELVAQELRKTEPKAN
ncbi:MAG: hypothetical protein ACHQ4G_02700 [Opitutales bacterium]